MINQDNAWPLGMREKVARLEAVNAEKDAEIERLRQHAADALAFLNSIEGAGYGGMSEFENVRRSLEQATSDKETGE